MNFLRINSHYFLKFYFFFRDLILFHSLTADRDLKLHLPNSQSENAIKQLKTLTSPLTKFAANIGSALDPRKYGSKVDIPPNNHYTNLSNSLFIQNNQHIYLENKYLLLFFPDGGKRGATNRF